MARRPRFSRRANIHLEPVLNQLSKAALDLPFYSFLPRDEISLLKWRIYVHERCIHDLEFRRDIVHMCSLDVAFFATTFCWAHETRAGAFTRSEGKFPFLPWPDQVDILAWFQMYGGTDDMVVEKTRGVGMSWVTMIYLMWKWLFSPGGGLEFGVLSKDLNSLDILDRPSTLMGKLDVLFAALPMWLRVDSNGRSILERTSSQSHKFVNRMNKNAVIGYVPSDDKLRSSRLNLIIVDEAAFLPVDIQRWLAASQFVSNSRIFVSTHDGTATMFYRLSINTESPLIRISYWWWNNQARAEGMYRVAKNGQVEIIDKDYDFRDYEFITDEVDILRSPWTDYEMSKPETDLVRLKQEIWGIAALDTKRMIQKEVTDRARLLCKPPLFRATYKDGDFLEDLEGDFYFWQDLTFTGTYYLGVDPSLGSVDSALGALVAIDAKTGAVVASAGFRDMNSTDLARNAVWLAEKLCGARGPGHCKIIHESTGIGVVFTTELKRLRWPNVYEHTKSGSVGMPNTDRGEKVLLELGRAIRDGDVVITDSRIIDDLENFEYDAKMNIVFSGLVGHGDFGQAAALAWWAAKERRKQFLDLENKPWNEGKQPIELEPGYNIARHKSRRRGFSSRFALQ